ncbi:hypothetical protein OIU79_028799 [Salix purpurea]|uniref:Uncharacterized protein n=1 Tax=Salix purpurea TaxID=77065 RepID=A0A9Q1A355_SALPP|nr:hypothetical protein OIU79_028799 [Salix purpurea]
MMRKSCPFLIFFVQLIVLMNENKTEEFQNMAIPVIVYPIYTTYNNHYFYFYILCKEKKKKTFGDEFATGGRTSIVHELKTLPLLEGRESDAIAFYENYFL